MLFFLEIVSGQSFPKTKVEQEDYDNWSTLMYENLSPNGKWITYKLIYDSGIDTLFVRHTTTSKQYYFPKGNNATFSNDDQWLTVNQENIVLLQNLITGEQKIIDSAIKSDFIKEGKQLIVLVKKSESQDLHVFDLKNGTDNKIQNVKEYVVSQDQKSVGYITQDNTVQLFWVNKKFTNKILMNASTLSRENLVWNDAGNSIALLEEIPVKNSSDTNHKIYFIKNVKEKEEIHCLNPTEKKKYS